MHGPSAGVASMAYRWADFITPSTLQLAPLLEVLLEPIACAQQMASLQLGLQEVLVNAVRHGNGNDPTKCLRVRRIVTPRWVGLPASCRCASLPDAADAICGRGLYLIHSCFDDVRWSSRGNRVQVALRRQ
jgi:serine/threonine-protein kinase RsbW